MTQQEALKRIDKLVKEVLENGLDGLAMAIGEILDKTEGFKRTREEKKVK